MTRNDKYKSTNPLNLSPSTVTVFCSSCGTNKRRGCNLKRWTVDLRLKLDEKVDVLTNNSKLK